MLCQLVFGAAPFTRSQPVNINRAGIWPTQAGTQSLWVSTMPALPSPGVGSTLHVAAAVSHPMAAFSNIEQPSTP